MRIAFFSTHGFDREFFDEANRPHGHDILYLEARLTPATSSLAGGAPAVCAFVNDNLHEEVLNSPHTSGVRLIALRSAGFNLHAPLTGETRHMVDAAALAQMKPGVMIISTSRGALVDAAALIDSLKSGHVGLDVCEQEEQLFFRDLSAQVIQDDVFARLLTFPNVLVTAHQRFFTREYSALSAKRHWRTWRRSSTVGTQETSFSERNL